MGVKIIIYFLRFLEYLINTCMLALFIMLIWNYMISDLVGNISYVQAIAIKLMINISMHSNILSKNK